MKFCYFIFSLILLVSCRMKTSEEKVQYLINKFVRSGLTTQDGYHPIEFGPLDSAFTSVRYTPDYEKNNTYACLYQAMEQSYLLKTSKYVLNAPPPDPKKKEEYIRRAEICADSAAYFQAICDSLKKAFVPEFIAWKMEYIYEAKNEEGVPAIYKYVYYFDKNLRRVKMIGHEQIFRNLQKITFYQNIDEYKIK